MKHSVMQVFTLASKILVLSIFAGFFSACQPSKSRLPDSEKVSEVIAKANAKELATLFGQVVELNFDGKSNDYSRIQAEFVLKSFFRQHPPQAFRILREGRNARGQDFLIGEYKCPQAQYRIYTALSKKEGRACLNQLSINRL